MRRNKEEVKAELSRRLDEYKEKRRVRRKLATVCITVALCSAVTVAAVPAMVAMEKNKASDTYPAGMTDKLDAVTEHSIVDVQTDVTDIIEGVASDTTNKMEGANDGDTEIIEGAMVNGTAGSADDMRVIFRDFPGLSGAKAEPIVRAYEALELERIEEFCGNVIITFNLWHGDADPVMLELTDKDELLIRINDYMSESTYYTASNMQLLKDALKDAGVLE